MLALRRLPRYAPRLTLARGNATLEAASSASAAASPPPPPAPATAKPPPAETAAESPAAEPAGTEEPQQPARPRGRTRRPHISLETPREWCRPIAKGVEPAYDLALRYILHDAAALRRELEEAGARIKAEEAKPEGERDEEALRALGEKVRILEVQAEINLPDVRWKAKNGMGECSSGGLGLGKAGRS